MLPTEKFLLITCECDYADEFDVEGFTVYKQSAWNEVVKELKSHRDKFPCEWYFGSNEEIPFDTPEDVLSCCRVKEISEEEYNTIIKLFRNGSYGKLPFLSLGDTDWEI